MGRLDPRPAVIPVYAKERLQFLASVKIRIFRGNKPIIQTFFPEGKPIVEDDYLTPGVPATVLEVDPLCAKTFVFYSPVFFVDLYFYKR